MGGAAAAQTPLPRVAIETDAGQIVVEVDVERAPVTAANFLAYVDKGLFRGGSFYRVVHSKNDNNAYPITVVQGGLGPEDRPSPLPPIRHEPTSETGLRHDDGAISMARDGPGTASSEFFIVMGDQPALDFEGSRNPDRQGFAAFGHVVKGMEVVRRINRARTAKGGQEAYTRGQRLEKPVTIREVRRLP
ncbi:peptidylprolyl isomerase [Phenylobacterium deserti]|uniref:peptidylprolyl isomerase n=2 Tax=Phenylobacterium deserti TaxID=1914756 RepID=A0A328AT73_9CAUL|nr:peptidylprolyl isomerase [Phenylobacterium deserti]